MTEYDQKRQMQDAMSRMEQWLSSQGKMPVRLQHVGEIDLYKKHYYMFKFKKTHMSRQWLLGIAGGYPGDDLEHCGHVFSRMETYQPCSARREATAMVEYLHDQWLEQAFRKMEKKTGLSKG